MTDPWAALHGQQIRLETSRLGEDVDGGPLGVDLVPEYAGTYVSPYPDPTPVDEQEDTPHA